MHHRIFFVLMLCFTVWGCSSPIVHNLPEAEANEIVAVLQEHGVVAQKTLASEEDNTWTVNVPRQAQARSWSVLDKYKLPKQRERRFRDVFGKSKLVVTPMEEKALYLEALQGEIAETLESIDGVIDSRVHLVLPRRNLSGAIETPAKGSVVLEYQPDSQGTPPVQAVEIQNVVAHGVEGLESEGVVVVLKPSSIASPSSTGVGFDLVSFAGLAMEKSSIDRFKFYVVVVMVAIGLLAFLILLNGRSVQRLQAELERSKGELRRVQRRAAAPPQKLTE